MKNSMIMDLHVHTTISKCSKLTLEEILDNAAIQGLDGVCITDHDTMDVRHRIDEGIQANGLCVIFGMEYATPDGDFLLFGPFEYLEPGLDARQLLQMVDNKGGVAIAAHPFRPGRSVSEFAVREGLCSVVERVNGRNKPEANEQTLEWFDRYDLAASGGSDAHSLEELGRTPSRILAPIAGRADFIEALKAGLIEPATHLT
ncbi:PHP domain-containing protein [uncultured Pseudodesulfovibrio sp.]|uniref:PHP domain-containing protein n=1 Tax=uncultured Pseudodesulfovibrio sp. TaxID=2035858 RepID=UPI0029C81B74|nr:PHP domain-containing protein [uncultured Pseudodesulfovibrio sp.]